MKKILFCALFLLPVLILLPHLGQFSFQRGSQYSDIVISHYPNALYLERSLAQYGVIPLWSSSILSGYPFFANPLSGLYYPPGWLALVFTLPFGFNLMLTAHLIWGGVGMYRLMRQENLEIFPALAGALAFEALPKLYAHIGAGHLTLVYAVCWTPWLLLVERRCNEGSRLRWVLPGAVLGLIVLADVRWAAYAGLFWLAYSLLNNWNSARHLAVNLPGAGKWLAARLTNILFAGLAAAPMLLPLAQYTQLTTRSQMSGADRFFLSLPPGNLLGLLYPVIGGAAEWVLYPGAVILCLAIFALFGPGTRRSWFWAACAAAALIFSLGSYVPPVQWLSALPGMDMLRVPPRMLFLSGFCLAACAGLGMQSLLEQPYLHPTRALIRSRLVLFGTAMFAGLFAAAAWFVVAQRLVKIQMAWGAVFLMMGAAVIILTSSGRISPRRAAPLLLAAGLIDLMGINGLSLDFHSTPSVLSEGQAAADMLAGQLPQGLYRVYSPSYSIPQQTAAWWHLELADGIDPLQLSAYVRYMESATGVTMEGYSVTLPSFASGQPAVDNRDYLPDPVKLGLLNVRYVVSAFPLETKGLRLLDTFESAYLYENTQALPRAWVQPGSAPLGMEINPVSTIEEAPNRIDIRARGPGLLVLSELAYPGWQARIDGQTAAVLTVGGLLRGMNLTEGEHEISFTFRPAALYIGLALSAVAWAVLILMAAIRRDHSGRTL